jgi:RNA recognition motif-containing protein
LNIPPDYDEKQAQTTIENSTNLKMSRFVLGTYPNGASKGHGWASYSSHSSASAALSSISSSSLFLNNHHLSASFAHPRAFDPRSINTVRSLFVKGLPITFSSSLRSSFSNFVRSNIPSSAACCFKTVSIPNDGYFFYIFVCVYYILSIVISGHVMGHGYIHFVCHTSAELAISSLENKWFEGKLLHFEWVFFCLFFFFF